MPHLLRTSSPPTLHAYITIPLSTSSQLINQIESNFNRGAYAAYDASVRLDIDRSERFLNKSPRDVKRVLEEEGEGRGEEGFLIVDEVSEGDGGWSVLWVEGWGEEGMEVVGGEGGDGDMDGDEKVLLMVRMVTADVPTHYLTTQEGETDIYSLLPYPYNPTTAQTTPPTPIFDWTHNPPPPPPIPVVASPDEYEVSTAPEILGRFLIPGANGNAGSPAQVVRLKEEVARGVGLRSGWAVGVVWDGREKGKEEEGSLVFEQGWEVDGRQ